MLLGPLALLVGQAPQVLLDLPVVQVPQGPQELLGRLALLVGQVPQGQQGQQGQLVQQEQLDRVV